MVVGGGSGSAASAAGVVAAANAAGRGLMIPNDNPANQANMYRWVSQVREKKHKIQNLRLINLRDI